jgi:zinc protease
LAALCASLLDKGTIDLTADQIAMQFEDVGAIYSAQAARDRVKISLRTLSESKQLTPALALLAKLINNPAFSDQDVERVKNEILVELKRNAQQPSVIAGNAFFDILYPNHPYGHPVIGTEKTVLTISKEDLAQFHKKYFVAKNASVVIVGDLSEDKAKEISNALFQSIEKGDRPDPIPPVADLQAPIEMKIAYPSEQSHIFRGAPCTAVGDADYFPLLVGNYILGGNPLMSRFFQEVREKRGLVYHVSSRIIELREKGPFVIKAQTKNAQAIEALSVIDQTLRTFLEQGPTDQELEEAKHGIINAFPLELSNNAKIAQTVSELSFYGLPSNYLKTYQEEVSKVTLDQIKKAFHRHIHPEKMALIVVGNSGP